MVGAGHRLRGQGPLALFALMTLAGEGSLAIALKHSRPEDDVRIFSLMVAWLVVVVVSVTWRRCTTLARRRSHPAFPRCAIGKRRR